MLLSLDSKPVFSNVFQQYELQSIRNDWSCDLIQFLPPLQTLTDALCKELGRDELKLQSKVLELCYSCNPSENWSVSSAPMHNKQSEKQSFDAVIMTVSIVIMLQMVL